MLKVLATVAGFFMASLLTATVSSKQISLTKMVVLGVFINDSGNGSLLRVSK
jgi:hypothetical protein